MQQDTGEYMTLVYKPAALIVAFAIFVTLWTTMIPMKQLPAYAAVSDVRGVDAPFFSEHWISHGETTEAHSANIVINQGKPVVVWYGGTEEGHKDVAIFLSTFEDDVWSEPRVVTNRAMAEAGLNRYIRKIGNPALHSWPDGSLGLFFVTVSFGGWGAANISYMESPDLGVTWSEPERLVTSPFLNISTLVRADGLNLQGGDLSLPVYHEMAGKFAETLHLTRSRVVMDKVRISRGKHSLQPAIANTDDQHGYAMLRYAGNGPAKLLASKTFDGGLHWEAPHQEDLPNPDAAVALLNLGDNALLMALNDLEDGRHKLSLAINEDIDNGGEWRIIKTLEEESPEPPAGQRPYQFSYPSFAKDDEGFIHLVYTWNVKRIRHLRFNRASLIMPASSTEQIQE